MWYVNLKGKKNKNKELQNAKKQGKIDYAKYPQPLQDSSHIIVAQLIISDWTESADIVAITTIFTGCVHQ